MILTDTSEIKPQPDKSGDVAGDNLGILGTSSGLEGRGWNNDSVVDLHLAYHYLHADGLDACIHVPLHDSYG